ncbi:uncharacterized protein K452DRAFT_286875 [Aplosporella prunicola CBS 121167]|uniref:Uncharacterized protein n=1 Tax=Aplosporella prunicola CBS 121167 TaxID=1176127 RepID=A0A6A6BFW7_9PEZI|nr:uncharacterized protein K452DRAFT_286875 [Aplosporella prunicola CBS 121167]KAF2142458.1 hypothetical protein K452DRAFT_286875 [Aplosporella prunicola CBS 121167]
MAISRPPKNVHALREAGQRQPQNERPTAEWRDRLVAINPRPPAGLQARSPACRRARMRASINPNRLGYRIVPARQSGSSGPRRAMPHLSNPKSTPTPQALLPPVPDAEPGLPRGRKK